MSHCSITEGASGGNRTSTHRLAMVTSSGGTVSQSKHEDGGRRRLLDRLQQRRGGPDGEMHVRNHQHLTPGLEGPPLGQRGQPARVVDAEGGPRPLDHHQVGMGPGQRAPAGVAHSASAGRAEQGRREGPRGRSGPRPVGAKEQIGVHGMARRGPQGRDGRVLADHVGEQLRRPVGRRARSSRPVRMAEPVRNDLGHRARHLVYPARSLDDRPGARVPEGECSVAVGHPLVETGVEPLEAVGLARADAAPGRL
jgi:hypothetical protein